MSPGSRLGRHSRGVGSDPRGHERIDRCLALPHPFDATRHHTVIFPKEDIKNIADVTVADQPYLMDYLAVIRALVVENGLRGYLGYTNGPATQDVRYPPLHFTGRRGRRCRSAVWQETKDQEMIRIEAGLGRIPERVRRLGTRG